MALMMVLAGCSSATLDPDDSGHAGVAEEIQVGGIARVAALGEMRGFDPINLTTVGTGLERAAQVMDTLLVRDEMTDEVRPKLAEQIESDDGQTWRLTLREGVTFTDGEPLDAEAVIFNLERHLAEDSPSPAKALLAGVDVMSATGTHEVTFELSEPSGSFPLALTGSSPASLIGSPKALADPDAFNSRPVGAGPFTVENWARDDSLTLKKNPNYWDEGKPYLDGVVYQILTDPQTRTDDLISGGTHLALINGPQWPLISQYPELTLTLAPGGGEALIPNNAQGPGADLRVRQAIAQAFAPTVTAELLVGGTEYWDGDRECLPFSLGSPACAPGTSYTQDLDAAKALIADYVADGGDPVMEFVYFQSNNTQATYYMQQLTEIGLDIRLRSVDVAGLTSAQAEKDYDLLMNRTASAGYPTGWTRLYSGGTNWGARVYPELDEALIQARDSLELEDRNAAWRDVAKIVYDNAILTWTAPYTAAMAVRSELHLGTADNPYDGSTMVYLDSAWLEN